MMVAAENKRTRVRRWLAGIAVLTPCLWMGAGLEAPKVEAQTVYHRDRGLEVMRGNRCGAAEYLIIYESGLRQYQQGQFRRALETFQSYQQLARNNPCRGNPEQEIIALNRLGLVYESLGQYQQAQYQFEQAQALNQQNPDDDRQQLLQGIILNNLGAALVKLGEYQTALDTFEAAATIHAAEDELAEQGTSYTGIGLAYFEMGRYADALVAYKEAQTLFLKADVQEADGSVPSARGLRRRARRRRQNRIARLQQESRRLGGLVVAQGISLNGIGNAQTRLKRYDAALASFDQALIIQQNSEARPLIGLTQSDRAQTLIAMGQLEEAETTLNEAIDILDSLRQDLDDNSQISIFETQASAYQRLQYALVAQGKTDAALEIAERGRARAFVAQLSQRLDNQDPDRSNDNFAEDSNAELESGLAQTLTGRSPTIEDIRQIAQAQNSTLVSYSINQTIGDQPQLYIWVIQPTGEIHFEQVAMATLQSSQLQNITNLAQSPTAVAPRPAVSSATAQTTAVQPTNIHPTPNDGAPPLLARTRHEMGVDRSRGDRSLILEDAPNISIPLQDLHQLLIQPIQYLLPTAPSQRVVFIPQGSLFLVPFVALQNQNGTYLIEQHTVLTAPSIQVLALTATLQKTARAESLLVVGNPTMPSFPDIDVLPALPGAEREALDIAKLFNTTALVRGNASESVVKAKMPEADVIHLATHGLLEYGWPEDSGVKDVPGAIVLAEDLEADGLLTASEILDLNLRANLVVLSACDTGRGRVTGDGVIGLSRSLIIAGAPSVIVSLWSVPDAPTAELMVEFYQQLRVTSDKAQALRQAMLTTLESHPHPRDWAAFTLIGSAQ
ncbi:MAG: CHAT domain-containing tetratricopeptide repeat protein [Cyanobacteria bacterium P01_F01_bin.150]